MRISYVSPGDQNLASCRYRILIPASHFNDHEIFVDTEPEPDSDIVVFCKHYDQNVAIASKCDGMTVYDICDDHFSDEYRVQYKHMCRIVDVVTCNSEAMAARIKEVTGRTAYVIPDPYEMPRAEPKFAPGETPKLLWFGHSSNLEPLATVSLVGELEIVTNCEPRIDGPVTYTTYSQGAVLAAMQRADMVIIPQNRPCKSANRLIESLRQGRFVVASDIPAYREFEQYAYIGDVSDGIKWALQHPAEALERVRRGQEYIAKHYTPEIIGKRWLALFEEIVQSDVETRVNIGSGGNPVKGWINVDLDPRADVNADVRKLPFDTASVDVAQAIHVIEHIYYWDVQDTLKEWLRILKPGGKLILECPDILKCARNLVEAYDRGELASPRLTIWGMFGDPHYKNELMMHKWGYMPETLIAEMEKAGFVNVSEKPPQTHMREKRDLRVVGYKP